MSLEKIPTEFTSESTVVNGATIVNYVNSTNAFGNTFLFNYGSSSIDSNACHYGQVYQGLASSTIGTTFELATDNGTALFPGEVDNSYVTALYSNVGVQFKKDTDGYWTLDSKYYKYVYNSGNTTNESNGVIEANTGSGFWPFQVNGGNDIHYGMVMPISFRVNSDGTTTSASGDTEDTVFKFSGDDDVFVYVDGQLVLDLGGIHNAVYGQIDFKTGDILIQGYSADGRALTSSLDSTAYANESLGTKNLYEIVAENNVSEFSESNHVLTVVYFERGGNVSNCKISYNFVKNETTNVSYEGLKVERNEDGTYSPLEGATFTLYTDEECNNVAEMSLGGDAITTSDADGTILFENLSAGIADDNNQTTKTYYMKETAAPEGYDTPSEAIWKLVISYDNGTFTRILTAFNDSALAISLNSKGKVVSDSETEVKSIKNTKTPVAKELKVEKVVSDGTTVNPDPNARYVFYLGLYTGNDSKGNPLSTAVANKAYTVDNEEYFTDDEGKFSLKADEIAIFEELYGSKYIYSNI